MIEANYFIFRCSSSRNLSKHFNVRFVEEYGIWQAKKQLQSDRNCGLGLVKQNVIKVCSRPTK